MYSFKQGRICEKKSWGGGRAVEKNNAGHTGGVAICARVRAPRGVPSLELFVKNGLPNN